MTPRHFYFTLFLAGFREGLRPVQHLLPGYLTRVLYSGLLSLVAAGLLLLGQVTPDFAILLRLGGEAGLLASALVLAYATLRAGWDFLQFMREHP
jgi:hypothetical protein